MSQSTATNFTQPQAGDVVLCNFPQDLVNPNPGPKGRPAIVLEVRSEGPGAYQVIVCYATTNTSRAYPWDLVVDSTSNPVGFQAMGLMRATKFDLSQQVRLPFNSDWFAIPAFKPYGLTPKIGSLHATVAQALVKALTAAKKKT